MPPATVPSVARVAEKWSRRASGASQDYRSGVESTPKSWSAAASAAEANYKAGVIEAANAGRFGAGVKRVGDAKWKNNAAAKGPGRYSEGVTVGAPDFASGIAPVLDTIARTDLPPRGPAGTEANYNRSSAIGRALRKLKTGGK